MGSPDGTANQLPPTYCLAHTLYRSVLCAAVHRDLKPENFLFKDRADDSELKVMFFFSGGLCSGGYIRVWSGAGCVFCGALAVGAVLLLVGCAPPRAAGWFLRGDYDATRRASLLVRHRSFLPARGRGLLVAVETRRHRCRPSWRSLFSPRWVKRRGYRLNRLKSSLCGAYNHLLLRLSLLP